ncbi:MAG TPA: hypothetical protein VJ732_00640 [Bryobacteraceae bacterium]|nr:hypothetical protein [Bryobacteraceae bacterium]
MKTRLVAKIALSIAGIATAAAQSNPGAAAKIGMLPAAQQNALVEKYCAVCHRDAHPNGRLSFEHFDAANADPGVAAIMAAKLRTGALGASGQRLPDKATQDALLAALTAESAGAENWVLKRSGDQVLTASIVRQLPSTNKDAHGEPDLYRLQITCNAANGVGAMDLEWSPGEPKQGGLMLAAVDGKPAFQWKVEGKETMGNGQAGTSGPGAAALRVALPAGDLTVTGLFPDETVTFPFSNLDKKARRELSVCFRRAGD